MSLTLRRNEHGLPAEDSMVKHPSPASDGIKRIVLVLILFFAAAPATGSCSPRPDTGSLESLTLALVPTEINALLYIAKDQEYFAANGLQVTLKEDYESGAAAAIAMLNGEAQIAVAAEFPIVRQVFNGKDISSFGTIARYENTFIIWRTDSGIRTVKDLPGKKIGVTLQTISEFYLGRTLELNGIHIQEVTLVDVKAAEAGKALADGQVEAVVTWEPWAYQVNQNMQTEVTTRAVQSSQYAYWNLVSTRAWTNQHPDTIERLIRALIQAEDFVTSYPDKARDIVGKWMKFDDAYLQVLWPRYQLSLSLDQSLLLAMEDEARWLIKNDLTTETTMPHFLDYLYLDGLEAVRPEAVNIIR
jgi:NitT/TauT family transport system substrate-binding protein